MKRPHCHLELFKIIIYNMVMIQKPVYMSQFMERIMIGLLCKFKEITDSNFIP